MFIFMTFIWHDYNTLRYGVGMPRAKIGVDYKLIKLITDSTPKNMSILAPEHLSAWMPLIPNHPELIFSRFFYTFFFNQTKGTFTQEELLRRIKIYHL